MKNIATFLLAFCLFYPLSTDAKDFLGAPIIPEGMAIHKADARLEFKTRLSHDEAVTFYREALKGFQDIKFRKWEDATYIEDHGKLDWHSITIPKGDQGGITVVIVKDNWTWIMGTLLLRYVGVFAVLLTLFLGMALSGRIISRSVKKIEARKTTS
jgi:hypothetical protein